MNLGALEGVRVLDLADESAAFAGRILADLGAEVILVEPPEGSRTRHLAPYLDDEPGTEHAFFHLYTNANKRSVVIDRESAKGRAHFEGLVASADVVIETAPVARRADLGLDHESLRAANPRLIHASVTPFGCDGDWRGWRASDLVATAASGLSWLCGERDGPPWHGSGRPSFALASLGAATGVVAALTARDRNDAQGGAHLEISLQEAATMAAIQSATPTFWSWFGTIPRRPALSNAIRCRDGGYVGMLVRPATFELFRAWVAEAGTKTQLGPDDAHWAELYAPRKGNPVSRAVLELAERYDRDAFADRAAEAQTICLPIMDFPSMAVHPQYLENGQFFDVEHAGLRRALGFVRSPVDAVAGEVEIAAAPKLGADTQSVLEPVSDAAVGTRAPSEALDPYRALEGVRVVDFCWVLAGPLGGRLLANFGADVIRVESARHIDGMRRQRGPDGEPNSDLGGLFNSANAGKRSFTVDLSTDRGRELVLALVARSDVVTNNFRPGALDRMGLGYGALCERRSDIILLNLPGTHRTGPWSARPTTGNVVMAASGLNVLMGFPGQRPRGYGVAYPDFTSPYLLATAVMAALRLRDRTGEGREMDLAQLSATISLLGPEWMRFRETGVAPPPAANRDPNHCPHGHFPAKGSDEWCAISVESDDDFRRLCSVIGREDIAGDPRFENLAARKANEDALDEIVTEWTTARDRWEVAATLQAAGVAAAPVEHLRDTLERDPQLRHHYQRVRHPAAPEVELPLDREAIRFAGVEHQVQRGPIWGEHNEEIVRDVLGLDDEAYTRLVRDDVLV